MANQTNTPNPSKGDFIEQDFVRHSPASPLQNIEEHLLFSCHLSRALWCALDNPDLDTGDERDRLAILYLASDVAHHASAVYEIWHSGETE